MSRDTIIVVGTDPISVTAIVERFEGPTIVMGVQGPPGAGLNLDKDALRNALSDQVRSKLQANTPDVHPHDLINEESLNRQKRVLDSKMLELFAAVAAIVAEVAKED